MRASGECFKIVFFSIRASTNSDRPCRSKVYYGRLWLEQGEISGRLRLELRHREKSIKANFPFFVGTLKITSHFFCALGMNLLFKLLFFALLHAHQQNASRGTPLFNP